MARRRRVEEPEEHANHERWLLTYSDMITLLMVLFIVLFALGQTDVRKFNAFKQSFHTTAIQPAPVLQGGTGVLDAANSISLSPPLLRQEPPKATPASTESSELAQARTRIQAALAAAGLGGAARFSTDQRGLEITIVTDHVLFDVGSATLRPEGLRIIGAIAPTLASLPNQLSVEGHTDNQPISGGRYPTNWELSTARATAVLRYLIDAQHLAPGRLSATGYADTRPLVPNDTPAHQATNRRVEIVVLSAATSGAPSAATAP